MNVMRHVVSILAVAVAFASATVSGQKEGVYYGQDQGATRYSTLDKISADNDSGTFDRNTAATTAALTAPPLSRLTPIATDSGTPSSSAPTTIAAAEPPCCWPPERFRWLPPLWSTM